MSENTIPPAILAALDYAQAHVRAAVKRKKHDQYSFFYAPAEEVVRVAKQALRAAGLLFALVSNIYTPAPSVTGPESGTGKVTLTFVLCLAATGEQTTLVYDVPVCPNKGRPADKAAFASDTEGTAYALRGLLLIARPGADDISGRREEDPIPPRVVPPKTPAPAKPARPWPLPACTPEKLAADMREIAASSVEKIRASVTLADLAAVMSSARQGGLFNWLEAEPVFRACGARLLKIIEDADALALDALSASLPRFGLPDVFAAEVKAKGQTKRREIEVLS